MVCSRGESFTHHTNRMKLFNAIAAAAIGISLLLMGAAKASSDTDSKIIFTAKQCAIKLSQYTQSSQYSEDQFYGLCDEIISNKSFTDQEILQERQNAGMNNITIFRIQQALGIRQDASPGAISTSTNSNYWQKRSARSQQKQCPPGTRHYRTNGLFGIGARDIGCMTAYEAESLRRQNVSNFQNNLNHNRTRNCTTNFIGSTAYTNCY